MKNKFYRYLLLSNLLIFISGFAFSQNSEYQYIENFEGWPAGWGVYNRNNPGPTNYTWFKSNNASIGSAHTGTTSSYLVTGITSDVEERDNISQWVFTNTFPITNGDKFSFYTKSFYGQKGTDRLQVRLAKTSYPYVEGGSTAVGDFNEQLLEINPAHSDQYPGDWTKYEVTITSLAEGEVIMGRLGFRYYIPNVGCSTCSTTSGSGPSVNSIGLTPEESMMIDYSYMALENAANLSEGAGAISFLATFAFGTGVAIADALRTSFDASMVGIDNFVYNPVDIKLKNHNGDYFVHNSNPTTPVATFYKNFCLSNDVEGENVLNFTIDNKGPLFNITNAEITGADAASFSFWSMASQQFAPPTGAAANRPATFSIRYNPTTSGNKEAIVVLTTNHPSIPQIKFKIAGTNSGDPTPPTLVARTNVNLNINDGGTYQIPATLSHVDVQKYIALEYSYYECDFTNMTWSVVGGAKNFTTSDVGTSPVITIEGFDSRYGLSNTCPVTVNIIDITPPVITTPGYTLPDETYYLHPDSAFLYKKDLIAPTVTFQDNSGNIVAVPEWNNEIIGGHGTYGLTWHFEDSFGNKAFKIFNQKIHVIDNTAPVAIAKDVEIGYNLDKATVWATNVNNGSYDNSSKDLLFGFWKDNSAVPAYGITNDTMLVDKLTFDCADAGTTQAVKFVVKDLKTNQQSSVTANVSIAEIGPGICKNTKVYLSGQTSVSISPSEVYLSSGTCDATSIFMSQSAFSCDDVGVNYIEVTAVSDVNGTNTCTAEVRVFDYPSWDPEERYAAVYGDSKIDIAIEDPLFTYATVNFYRPYELSCPDSTVWSYQSSGSTVIPETTLSSSTGGAQFYPGTSFLRIKQVHPTRKDMYGQPLTTNILKTITVRDTIPLLVSNAYNIPAFIYDNNCSTSVPIRCPWDSYFAARDKIVGNWGYELTGATEKLVTDRLLGPEKTIDEEINLGITNVKFFGFDIGGNILDTVNITIDVQRANIAPEIKCLYYTIPNEFENPYTLTIKDPIVTYCEVDNTVTWDVKVMDISKSYTWFSLTGLKDEETTQVTLSGDKVAYNGLYYMETIIRQNGQAKGACYTQINLYDKVAPEIICPDTAIVQLDKANCDVNYSVNRPLVANNPQNKWYFTISGDASYSSPELSYATASSNVTLAVGEYTITLFGKDAFGNTSSCSSQIIVQDVIAPDVTCAGNVTVSLPSDACEAEIGSCDTAYNFAGEYGPNRIEKIALNSNGYIDFSQAPSSITIHDGNTGYDVSGNIIARFRIACDGIFRFNWNYTPNSVDGSYLLNQPFYRILGGARTLLTGFDENAETANQSGTVIISAKKGDIIDVGIKVANNGIEGSVLTLSNLVAPSFTPAILQPAISESCNYTFTSNLVSAYQASINIVTYKVVDEHGNTTTCKQTITIEDNNPVSASAKDSTFYLNEDGEITVKPEDLLTSCLSFNNTLSQSKFTTGDLGANSVTITSYNTLGDSSSTTSTVTIVDTLKPFLKYNVLDFVINPSITDTLTESDMLPMAGDNCSVQSITASKLTFDCSEIGNNAVNFIVVDGSGNLDTLAGWVNVIPDGFSVSNEIGEQKVCSGDTAIFSISATNVASYQWQREKEFLQWESLDTLGYTHPLGYKNTIIQDPQGFNNSRMVKKVTLSGDEWLYVAYQTGNNWKIQYGSIWEGVYIWDNWYTTMFSEPMESSENSVFDIAVSKYNGPAIAARTEIGGAYSDDDLFLKITIPHPSTGTKYDIFPPVNTYSGDWVISNVKLAWPNTYYNNELFVATTRDDRSGSYPNNRITVRKYNFTNGWSTIGAEDFSPETGAMDMDFQSDNENTPFIAFVTTNGHKVSVMKPHTNAGTTIWEYVGNQAFATARNFRNTQIDLKFHNREPYVAFIDEANGNKVTVKKLFGNQWVNVGLPGFSKEAHNDVSLVFQGDVPYLSYSRYEGNAFLLYDNPLFTDVYRFINGAWEAVLPSMPANDANAANSQAFSSIHTYGEDILMYYQDSATAKLGVLKLWEDIPGATSDTLIIPDITTAMNAKRVRCEYGTGCANRYTEPGYIYVDSAAVITSVSGDKFMDEAPGVLNLSASASYGAVEWFAADGLTSLGTGNNFTTPLLYETQNFYAKATDGRCKSEPVSVLAEIPFTEHNSHADTICRNEPATINIENQQEGHKYDVYTDDLSGNDSLVTSWVSDGWPSYPRIQNLQKTTDFKIKNSTHYRDALQLGEYWDYVDFGNLNYDLNAAITIEAWIYKGWDGDFYPYLSYTGTDEGEEIKRVAFNWFEGTFGINYGDTLYTLDFPPLPEGWTHVATSSSATSMSIFYNGIQVASNNTVKDSLYIKQPTNPSFVIGRDGRFPNGTWGYNSQTGFDDVRVWLGTRSAYYVTQDITTCLDGTENGLKLDCNFNTILNDTNVVSTVGPNGTWYADNYRYGTIEGRGTCLTVDSIMMDTVTVFVRPYNGIGNYTDYFEGCAGSPIELVPGLGLDSLMWYDSPDPNFSQFFGYGDTLRVELAPDEEMDYYISSDTHCKAQLVRAYAYEIPALDYVTAETLCGSGNFVSDINFDWAGNSGVYDVLYWDAPEGGNLIYGTYENGYWVYPPEGEMTPPVFVGTILEGSDPEVTGTDTLYAEAYNNYCFAAERVPVVISSSPYPEVLSTTGGNICEPGEITVSAEGIGGTIEWWDFDRSVLLGTGDSFTTNITQSTGFYAYVYSEACSNWSYEVFAAANINASSTGDTTDVVSCGTYYWNDSVYATSGIYSQTLTNAVGCDSVAAINLTILDALGSDTTVYSCGDFVWRGKTISSSGVYKDTLNNVNGCDSILRLAFVNRTNYGDTSAVACSSFDWYGTTYTVSGSYMHILTNKYSCDSIVTLALTINEPTVGDTTAVACSSFDWYGNNYTTSGNYTHTLQNVVGCDSVLTLNLTINQPTFGDTTAIACESFNWYDSTYAVSGSFIRILQNSVGCDSTVTLDLTINNTSSGDTTAIACEGFTWFGTDFTVSGAYTHTLQTVAGCDSLVTLNLTINQPSTGDTTAVACSGFNWYGSNYTSSGSYTHTLQNRVGCDSVVTLNLSINQPSVSDTAAVACESFSWYDSTYTASGAYTHTLQNVSGCDSVVTLNLTINQSVTSDTSAVACESFSWFGTDYTESGEYMHTLQNVSGCDSVVTLNLTINQSVTNDTTATACESFSWFGTDYTESGDYTHTLQTVAGCDSVVSLNLTINQTVTSDTTATACESFSWYETNYTVSGNYTHTLQTLVGCDSVVTLQLTLNEPISDTLSVTICEGETYIIGNQNLQASGEYTEVFTSAAGCDSIVVVHLTVNPVYNTNETQTICKGESYMFGSKTLFVSGEYTETFNSVSGCDSIIVLTLTVDSLPGKPAVPTGIQLVDISEGSTDYTVVDIANAESYSWLLLPAASGTLTGSGKTATVSWSKSFTGNAKILVKGVNTCGEGSYSDSLSIIVASKPLADFSYVVNGLEVTFTNLSAKTNAYTWSFGDGKNSSQTNPSHQYANTGYFTVSLTAYNDANDSFDTSTKVIYVQDGTGETSFAISADFDYLPEKTTNKVTFTDKSLGTATHWYWDFGDNSVANTSKNPVYTYTTDGYYRVCLTTGNVENQSTSCKDIAVGDVSNSSTADFTYFADSLSLTAYFNNKSLGNIVSYYWDFGDGDTTNQKNPNHVYADTGYYAVCLTTVSTFGVSKTHCTDVRIGNAVADPCLYSCVWPGDANSDLEANHYDIMTIGLNYGLEGPKREKATIGWYGQFAQNWSTFQSNGINNKHGDCNGDGIINDQDTLAITQNFAFTHHRQPEVKGTDWKIYCEWLNNENEPSSRYATANVMLSSVIEGEQAEIYGVGYELELLNIPGIIWDSVKVDFENTWMGIPGEDLLTFYEVNAEKQTIFVAAVRKDHQNISGIGKIARVNFVMENGYTSDNISFNVTTLGGIKSDGNNVKVGGSILLNLGNDITLCQGDKVTIDAPNGFSSYSWNTGELTSSIEVSQEGTYILQIIDSLGYSTSDTIVVVETPNPEPELGTDITDNKLVILNAGEGFISYLWNTGDTTQTISITSTGTYLVKVTNEWGCVGADSINVLITGIKESLELNSLLLYPNPSNGDFWIVSQTNMIGEFKYELFDSQGKRLLEESIDVNGKLKHLVSANTLPQGVYLIKAYYQNQTTHMRMVIQ